MDKPCTKEENAKLFQQILGNDEGAKERFIKGNMAYVIAAVEDYVDKRPQFKYLQDDLISEGYLVLVRLSHSIHNDSNPQGLITTYLMNSFNKLVAREKRKDAERLNKKMLWDNKNEKRSRYEVLIACEDDLEKRIMTMHLDCHTDQEIADMLNLDQFQIFRIRKKITKKLQIKIS